MSDSTPNCTDAIFEDRRPNYRAILLAKSGAVFNAFRIPAENDEQAMEKAKSMVDGHAVELWDGARFIEHFPPVD